MRVYQIVIQDGKMSSEQSHYILAEDYLDAFRQAGKMLTRTQEHYAFARIESISEQFELEVVK
jgi:hypothetical protein